MNYDYLLERERTDQQSEKHVQQDSRENGGHSDTLLHPMLHLQQTAGNRAVGRMVQTKLMLGDVDTPSEREADQISSDLANGKPVNSRVRPVSGAMTPISPKIDSAIQRAQGSGQPLPEKTQSKMQENLGADLSGVRVHTDSKANSLNEALQARAFTTGQDIFFRKGEYNPVSPGGQKLLAHEISHVVQQAGGTANGGTLDSSIIQRNHDPEVIKLAKRFAKDIDNGDLVAFGDRHKGPDDFIFPKLIAQFVTKKGMIFLEAPHLKASEEWKGWGNLSAGGVDAVNIRKMGLKMRKQGWSIRGVDALHKSGKGYSIGDKKYLDAEDQQEEFGDKIGYPEKALGPGTRIGPMRQGYIAQNIRLAMAQGTGALLVIGADHIRGKKVGRREVAGLVTEGYKTPSLHKLLTGAKGQLHTVRMPNNDYIVQVIRRNEVTGILPSSMLWDDDNSSSSPLAPNAQWDDEKQSAWGGGYQHDLWNLDHSKDPWDPGAQKIKKSAPNQWGSAMKEYQTEQNRISSKAPKSQPLFADRALFRPNRRLASNRYADIKWCHTQIYHKTAKMEDAFYKLLYDLNIFDNRVQCKVWGGKKWRFAKDEVQ